LLVPSPYWLLSLGGDVLNSAKGAPKAPMPCLVVEAKAKVGVHIEEGQAVRVIVLESLKTEAILHANISGVVKAIRYKSGENLLT
jgi:3-methylcrotonyl-CoA carboxylase alpha subunit